MANLKSPENPFSSRDIPTLEWVRNQIASDYSIPHQPRMDMVSACNMVSAWFGSPLSMISANAEFFRRRFKGFHHLHAGVTERRVQNVKSLLLKCLRQVGLSTKLLPYQAALNADWQVLYDLLPGRYECTALSRFMRFCSKAGIHPEAMTDTVAEAYLEALRQESLVKDPRTNHQTVCRLWNKMAEIVDGWPAVRLVVPRYDDRLYAISDDLIHPDLLVAIDGYLAFLKGDDLFKGLKRPFRPRSIEAARGNIRRYLSALHHGGFDVGSIRSLEDMTRFAVFEKAMEWLWDRNGRKPSNGIGEIAWTIRCVAVKHLRCDEVLAGQYADALEKLRVRRTGLSPKNSAALTQFDDPVVVKRFLNLPDQLWQLAKKEGTGKRGSLLAQSAVAVEVLIFAPMRLGNLQNLRIDQHLNWVGDRLHINIPEAMVKNSVALDYILPPHASARVKTYIADWRDLFFADSNPHLFPGRNGKPKDVSALRRQIRASFWEHAGIKLTPHQVRHVAAKLLLDARPGLYEVVRKLLGHKSLTTTCEYYAGAETQAAITLYDDVILDLKRDAIRPHVHKVRDAEEQAFLDPLNPFGKGKRR